MVFSEIQQNITICTWNVGGLSSKTFNKLKDQAFLSEIDNYDIILLTETHISEEHHIILKGYSYYPVCRGKSSNNRYYGGLGILIRNTIKKGVQLMKNTSSEYQWLQLRKDFFRVDKDIFLCLAYVLPSSSGFQTDSTMDGFEAIERDVNKYRHLGYVAMCGDFNARTGNQLDYIAGDNSRYIPVDDKYIEDIGIPFRRSQDLKIDDRGKRLLDLCISARLRILNGRTLGDINGKFTCHRPVGSSVIDYFIISEELLTDVLYFHVHPFKGTLSDCHCKISTTIMLPHIPILATAKTKSIPSKFTWNKSSECRFHAALQHPTVQDDINILINGNTASTQKDIQTLADQFENVIIRVANSSLRTKNVNAKLKEQRKKWFDEDLFVKRRELFRKGNLLSMNPYNRSIRNNYFKIHREYTKLRKYKKKHFKQSILNQLDSLEKGDPKTYWNLVNTLKENPAENPESAIESDTWHEYFSALNSVNPNHQGRVNDIAEKVKELETSKTFSNLDYRITETEIRTAIKQLKTNKAPGLDRITNEMIRTGADVFIPCLYKLFNEVFSSGMYPKSWASGFVKPLHKKGDPRMPDNYRGITISSSVAKLFNIILNERLNDYLENNNCIDQCQIGFKKNSRTSDHMFILKCLIDQYTNSSGNRLYACFVDFRKAFDSVVHPGLKYKLLKLGIGGQFYNIIDSMYSNTELCVKINESLTNSFQSQTGVRQGDVLSPNLFKIFVNDIPKYLSNAVDSVDLNDKPIHCLLYADDIVMFSSSSLGLKQRLESLSKFCEEWCLDVNVAKTKVLIFNKTGKLITDYFEFNGNQIECVQHYCYLGVYFSASGSFNYGQQEIYQKSLKASFKLTKLITSAEPSINTSIHLYDHLIKPIVLYGSEIWGSFKTNTAACRKNDDTLFENVFSNNIADKSHMKYLKYILGVNKFSSNLAVLSETGRFPLYFSIVLSITKYLYRLENCSSGILHEAYSLTKSMHSNGIQTWYSSAMFILKALHLDISSLRNLTLNQLSCIVKDRLIKRFKINWHEKREKGIKAGKLDTYFSFKTHFKAEEYLKLTKFSLRQSLCKLRISAHTLMIESGRYAKKQYIQRSERICKKCNSSNVEDEFHFLLQCSIYNEERRKFLKHISCFNKYFCNLTDTEKCQWLFIQENIQIIEIFASFVDKCFDIRKKYV